MVVVFQSTKSQNKVTLELMLTEPAEGQKKLREHTVTNTEMLNETGFTTYSAKTCPSLNSGSASPD